jgi:hypothetical protein
MVFLNEIDESMKNMHFPERELGVKRKRISKELLVFTFREG